jgi:cardiolipin synthase A/B
MLDLSISPWILIVELVVLLGGFALALMLIADVLQQRRAPATTSAWLLVLLLLPYLGVLLYLLFGARKLARPRHRIARFMPQTHQRDSSQLPALAKLLQSLGQAGALPATRVSIHRSPEQALHELLELIRNARTRVLVDMYDFSDDATTQPIFTALAERARAGVDINVLVDDLGSLALRIGAIRELREAGAKVRRFRPVTKLLSLRIANLRNHRKIIVADGTHVWTGGRNLAAQYLGSLQEPNNWQDLSCVIEGPAARVYEDIACSDWRFSTGVALAPSVIDDAENSAPAPDVNLVQTVATGPDLRDDAWYAALLSLCFTVQRRLWLVTPYFVPDEALQNALMFAARRGVEVVLIVPKRSDNRLVDWVRSGYLRELQHCGATVRRYLPRMLHAKCLLADDHVAALGSVNLDARSLFLNYEVMSVFYSAPSIAGVASYIRDLMSESDTHIKRSTWWRETLSAPLRLLAPLL